MNKPVAWMDKDTLDATHIIKAVVRREQDEQHDIPLYTHPVKEEDEQNWKEMYWQMHELNHKHWSELKAHPVKELTDEEIISTMVQFDVYSNDDQCLIEAGRAILRKAQDK